MTAALATDEALNDPVSVPRVRIGLEEVDMSADVPRFAAMDDVDGDLDGLDVELAVPCRVPDGLQGGREMLGALIRSPGAEAKWVEGWRSAEFVARPPGLWEYFADGRWDNGQTTEVRWFRIARVEDAADVLEHLTTLLDPPQATPTASSQPNSAPVDDDQPTDSDVPVRADVSPLPLSIARIAPPSWLSIGSVASVDDRRWHELSGEQAEWGYAIPQMFRILNSPHAGHPLVRAPVKGDDPAVAAAYWSALLHLLTYSLGWIRPERGILAWHLTGNPVDDLRLQLLAEVWGADGMLDWFHTWTHGRAIEPTTRRFSELTGFVDDDEDTPTTPGWHDDQKTIADRSGVPAPCSHGGYDPLHLSNHLSGPIEEPPRTVSMIRTDKPHHRAVLLTDSMVGWYSALCREGAVLPDLGNRSWHVEVVVRPVGSLGVFRRSRETGIWFSGRHRYHTLGIGKHTWKNPPPIWQP